MDRKEFYFDQSVTDQDMNDAFDDVEAAFKAAALDRGGACPLVAPPPGGVGILTGFRMPKFPADVTQVDFEWGVAIDKAGLRILRLASSALNLTLDKDGGATQVTTPEYERWVSVFVKSHKTATDPHNDGHSPPVAIDWQHTEDCEICVVKEGQAPVGTAQRPALLSDGILVADFRRLYNSAALEGSFSRTEYAMKGLVGNLWSASTATSQQPRYREVGRSGVTNASESALHVYVRAGTTGSSDPKGGLAITQGCHWDDDAGEWVADGDLWAMAGAIFLTPDGRIRLCTRAIAAPTDHWTNGGETGAIGWTNIFEMDAASAYPEEYCHMRVRGGAIVVAGNGPHSYQRALVLAAGMPGGAPQATCGVMGCCTYPQPFLSPPSSVTLVPVANRGDVNVLSVEVDTIAGAAVGEIGVVMFAASTNQDLYTYALREVRAYTA